MEIMASKWSTRKTKKRKIGPRLLGQRDFSVHVRMGLLVRLKKRTKRVETGVGDLAAVKNKGFRSKQGCSSTAGTVEMGRKGHNAAQEGLLCERITEGAAAGDMAEGEIGER